jgi:hypothetical protein
MFCPKKGMPVFDEGPLKWWGLYTPFRQIYALYMRGFVQDLEYWDSTWDGLISNMYIYTWMFRHFVSKLVLYASHVGALTAKTARYDMNNFEWAHLGEGLVDQFPAINGGT